MLPVINWVTLVSTEHGTVHEFNCMSCISPKLHILCCVYYFHFTTDGEFLKDKALSPWPEQVATEQLPQKIQALPPLRQIQGGVTPHIEEQLHIVEKSHITHSGTTFAVAGNRT